MSKQEWARTVSFEAIENLRDRNIPPLSIIPDTGTWIRTAAADENSIREFLEERSSDRPAKCSALHVAGNAGLSPRGQRFR